MKKLDHYKKHRRRRRTEGEGESMSTSSSFSLYLHVRMARKARWICLLAVILLLLTFATSTSFAAMLHDEEGGGGGAIIARPSSSSSSLVSSSSTLLPSLSQEEDGLAVEDGEGSDDDSPRQNDNIEGGKRPTQEDALLIVGTVDGNVHAVGPDGDVIWSFDSGSPLVTSYQSKDLAEGGDVGQSSSLQPVIIPAVDGSLLVHTPGKGVQRSPLKAAQLVDRAPFIAGDGTIYTGSRTSEAIMVDLNTGAIVQRFKGPSADKIAHMIDPRLRPAGAARRLLWLGRVDHSLRALDPTTGQEIWNLTVSELTPLFTPPSTRAGGSTTMGAAGGGDEGGGSGLYTKVLSLAPGRSKDSKNNQASSPADQAARAVLDVLGPGPGWGGAGSLLATPEGGLHRRDPCTGRIRLLSPLGTPPVSAFVVVPGIGQGVPVPLIHTLGPTHRPSAGLGRPNEEEDEEDDASSSFSSEDDEAEWRQQQAWLASSSSSSSTISIGQLSNGRLYGVVLQAAQKAGRGVGGTTGGGGGGGGGGGSKRGVTGYYGPFSAIPHYLSSRAASTSSGALPSPPSPSTTTTTPSPSSSPPHPSGPGRLSTSQRPASSSSSLLSRLGSTRTNDCPTGYPTSLCSLRRSPSPAPSTSRKPVAESLSEGINEDSSSSSSDNEEGKEDGFDTGTNWAASCVPGGVDFPSCLLGVHHLLAIEAPPTTSSSNEQNGILDVWPRGDGSTHDWDSHDQRPWHWLKPTSWSTWARRDFLLILTLIIGFLVVKAVQYFTGMDGSNPLTGTGRWNTMQSIPPSLPSTNGGGGGEDIRRQEEGGQESNGSVASSTSSNNTGGVQAIEVEGGLQVGRLLVSDNVLGYGCHGTIVYRGLLDGRPVAVKRMLRAFHEAADREMRLLIESDGHPNVVRYFLREQAGDFVYLALELCVFSLRDVVVRMEGWLVGTSSNSQEAGNEQEGQRRVPRPSFMTGEKVIGAPPQVRGALYQIATGVAHLHSLRIVHRDLKPHNILLAHASKASQRSAAQAAAAKADTTIAKGEGDSSTAASSLEGLDHLTGYVCKISDMGVGKLLAMGQSSFGTSSLSGGRGLGGGAVSSSSSSSSSSMRDQSSVPHGPGSVGWQAPEVIMMAGRLGGGSSIVATDSATALQGGGGSRNGPLAPTTILSSSRRTQAVDVFSLGCVFYTVLVPGAHPFGEWYERERNIITEQYDISGLIGNPDAHDLIESMIGRDPARRPTSKMVLNHPFFWDDDRRLAFLVDFSDRLELEPPDSLLVLATEAGAAGVVGRSWDVRLDKGLLEDVNKYRKYDTASVRDCLRILRNKRHHFHELPLDIQKLMAPLPGGLYRYFQARFLGPLMHCRTVYAQPSTCLPFNLKESPLIKHINQARFPRLLMHCHTVCANLLRHDKIFRTYMGVDPYEDLPHQQQLQPPPPSSAPPSSTSSQEPTQANRDESVSTTITTEGERENGEARISRKSITNSKEKEEGKGSGTSSTSTTAANGASATASSNTIDEEVLSRVVVFAGGNLATSYNCRGWWRPADHWARRLDAGKVKPRPPHIVKGLADGKYRTRLCQHWEVSAPSSTGPACPMKKKGKCDFAHGPAELRVKEARRARWGSTPDPPGPASLRSSGGEDIVGQARASERSRSTTSSTTSTTGQGFAGGGRSSAGSRGSGGGGGAGRRSPLSTSGGGSSSASSSPAPGGPPYPYPPSSNSNYPHQAAPSSSATPSNTRPSSSSNDEGPWRRGMQITCPTSNQSAPPPPSNASPGHGGGGSSFADVLKKRNI